MKRTLLVSCAGLCVLLLVCMLVGHSLVMDLQADVSYRSRVRALASIGANAIRPVGSEGAPLYDLDRFEWWSWATMTDPGVVSTVLIGPSGAPVATHPVDDNLGDAVSRAVGAGADRVSIAERGEDAELVVCDLGRGHRLALLARSPGGRAVEGWGFAYFAAMAVVGVVFVFAGLVGLLRCQVLKPLSGLTALSESAVAEHSGGPARSREISFERLANGVSRLAEECRRSRACIARLRRSVDARITQETREIEIMLRHAEREAWRDPLTGLGNRRLLEDRGERLVSDHVACGEDLSIILLDLDNFKVLNDALGHAAGDELLAAVGQLLRDSIRGGDMGLRLGGDEFAVILPGTRLEEAYATADRLISLFGQQARRYGVHPRVSMSAGVSSLAHHGTVDAASLLSAADEGLYRAKRAGKGRVGVAPQPPGLVPFAGST